MINPEIFTGRFFNRAIRYNKPILARVHAGNRLVVTALIKFFIAIIRIVDRL